MAEKFPAKLARRLLLWESEDDDTPMIITLSKPMRDGRREIGVHTGEAYGHRRR